MSKNATVRLGILGAGFIGRVHAKTFQAIEGVELSGIYDVDNSLADALAKEYDVTTVHTSVEALMNSEDAKKFMAQIGKVPKYCFVQVIHPPRNLLLINFKFQYSNLELTKPST